MKSEKDKTVPIDDDFGMMLNWAVRYSCGRQSYAPHATIYYIRPLIPYLSDKTLTCMANDIKDHRDKPEMWGGLGDEKVDAPVWLKFLDEIINELAERHI